MVSQAGTAQSQLYQGGVIFSDLSSSGSIGSSMDYAGLSLFNGTNNTNLQPNVVQTNNVFTDGYGTQNYQTTQTGSQTTMSYSGYDVNGSTSGSVTIGFGGSSFSYSSASNNYSFNLAASGANGSTSGMGSSSSWNVGSSGFSWNNGSAYGSFDSSGVRFPDGSIQTTAYTGGGWSYNFGQIASDLTLGASSSSLAGSAPTSGQVLTYNGAGQMYWNTPSSGGSNPYYYNSVWIYNNWYSANIQNIYDSGSGMYYNVLTF
jgi:hypothetical protein